MALMISVPHLRMDASILCENVHKRKRKYFRVKSLCGSPQYLLLLLHCVLGFGGLLGDLSSIHSLGFSWLNANAGGQASKVSLYLTTISITILFLYSNLRKL